MKPIRKLIDIIPPEKEVRDRERVVEKLSDSKKEKIKPSKSRKIQKETSETDVVDRIFDFDDKKFKLKNKKKILFWGGIIILLIIIFSGAIFGLIILPKATISLELEKSEIPFDFNITIDAGINNTDLIDNKIPGNKITIVSSSTVEFSATGKKTQETKARGNIRIFNNFSTQPQPLVVNTRFQALDGKIFRLEKAVVVPGAVRGSDGKLTPGEIEVSVIADKPGPEYNIDSGKLTIPGFKGTLKYDGFYAESLGSMSGGAIGETIFISEEDIFKSKIEVTQKLRSELDNRFNDLIKSGIVSLQGTKRIEFSEFQTSKKAGEVADKFNTSLEGSVTALLINEKYVKDYIKTKLVSEISLSDKPQNDFKINYSAVKLDDKLNMLEAKITGNLPLIYDFNETNFKKAVGGKKLRDLQGIFDEYVGIDKVLAIKFWPIWVSSVPRMTNRIYLEYK